MHLIAAFADEAIRIAMERELPPGSDEAWAILEGATELASSITFTRLLGRLPFGMEQRSRITAEEARRIFHFTHDVDAGLLVADAKAGHRMKVDGEELEHNVGSYLASEFRPSAADRALLVALFDMEITAYLKTIYEKNLITGKRTVAEIGRPPVVTWSIGRAWAVLRLFLAAAAVLWASNRGWIAPNTALILLAGAVVLFSIGTVVSFFSYLSFRNHWKANLSRLVELPAEMVGFYAELHSAGPLSVKRVRHQAQKLADAGAVWPGGVWALLDDLEARGATTLIA